MAFIFALITYSPAVASGLGIISTSWLFLSALFAWLSSIYSIGNLLGGFSDRNPGEFRRENSSVTILTVMRLAMAAVLFGISYLFR